MLIEAFAYDAQMPFRKTVEVFSCRMDETANIAVEAQVSVYSFGERKLKRGGALWGIFFKRHQKPLMSTLVSLFFLSPSVQFRQLQ